MAAPDRLQHQRRQGTPIHPSHAWQQEQEQLGPGQGQDEQGQQQQGQAGEQATAEPSLPLTDAAATGTHEGSGPVSAATTRSSSHIDLRLLASNAAASSSSSSLSLASSSGGEPGAAAAAGEAAAPVAAQLATLRAGLAERDAEVLALHGHVQGLAPYVDGVISSSSAEEEVGQRGCVGCRGGGGES